MPKKPNYGFNKRVKEVGRKQKQEAKLARKAEAAQRRAEEAARLPDATAEKKE